MALRLIRVIVPNARRQAVGDAVAQHELLGHWTHELGEGRGVVDLLTNAEKSQAILDTLEQEFSAEDGFRLLSLPVEATIPNPEDGESGSNSAVSEGARSAVKEEPERIPREELMDDLSGGTHVSRVYVATTLLSATVAVVGLVRDNVAILIGAMVIAPLLTPNVALALATTLGDLSLASRAFRTNVVGCAAAFLLTLAVGLALPFDPQSAEIASRCHVGLTDVVVGFAAGVAGTLACTTGVASGLIGVMVAVALLPPLATFGLLVGAGEFAMAWGAFLLVAINVICINLAGVVTFVVQGIRPRTWWEADRAKRATRIAIATWSALLVALLILVRAARGS